MTKKHSTGKLDRFVRPLQAGDPVGHLNLTLVPLRGEGRGRLDYILAAEALEAGTLEVAEVSDSGSVPELLAINPGESMILLLDGEELVGAKQNRILNTSILLRPKSQTKIPVSCVEQGRWRHTSQRFASGGYSPSRLRARKSRDVAASLERCGQASSDQGAVWEEVECCMSAMHASSPTMAMRDATDQRRESLDAYLEVLSYPDGARGVIAAVNGRFAAADVFDRPETLSKIWPRLVSGYAMDALWREKEKAGPFTAKAADVLLEHMAERDCNVYPSAGVGDDWRFEVEDILGQALVAEDVCVHLSVFPNVDEDSDPSRGPRILPPSRRRRGRN